MKDIVRNLYENLLRLTGGRAESTNAEFDELFPPVEVLSEQQVEALSEILDVKIDSAPLYEQALTHRSYLQVLDSWLVNKNSLVVCAKALGLDSFLFLSYSAQQSLDRGNDGMLADAMEAIIAAIYLDKGFEEARRFIVEKMLPIMVSESLITDTNYKSLLLELVQAKGHSSPRYVVVKEEGPDHEKEFTVDVLVDGQVFGSGKGKNKKEAEQCSAQEALKRWESM